MKPRPAYHKRLMPLHDFDSDHGPGEPRCKRIGDDGRPCALPRNNRHHQTKTTTQPAEQPEDEQLRLDING